MPYPIIYNNAANMTNNAANTTEWWLCYGEFKRDPLWEDKVIFHPPIPF